MVKDATVHSLLGFTALPQKLGLPEKKNEGKNILTHNLSIKLSGLITGERCGLYLNGGEGALGEEEEQDELRERGGKGREETVLVYQGIYIIG